MVDGGTGGGEAPAPRPATPSPLSAATLAAVAIGGALGTAARAGIGLAFDASAMVESSWSAYAPLSDEPFDPATVWGLPAAAVADPALIAALVANLLGTLVLGVVSGAHWPARLEWLRAGVGPGFCGAFTTFSLVTLALGARDFGSPWAWALLVAGLVGGLLLAAVGLQIGRGLWPAAASAPAAPPMAAAASDDGAGDTTEPGA